MGDLRLGQQQRTLDYDSVASPGLSARGSMKLKENYYYCYY